MAGVQIYDEFYTYDFAAMASASFKLALLNHSYVIDLTAASAATILGANEVTGSGYAQITGVSIKRDTNSGRVGLYKFDKSGAPTFPSMTLTDYQFLLYFDSVGDHPLVVWDAGSLQTVTAANLIVSGDVFGLQDF